MAILFGVIYDHTLICAHNTFMPWCKTFIATNIRHEANTKTHPCSYLLGVAKHAFIAINIMQNKYPNDSSLHLGLVRFSGSSFWK